MYVYHTSAFYHVFSVAQHGVGYYHTGFKIWLWWTWKALLLLYWWEQMLSHTFWSTNNRLHCHHIPSHHREKHTAVSLSVLKIEMIFESL